MELSSFRNILGKSKQYFAVLAVFIKATLAFYSICSILTRLFFGLQYNFSSSPSYYVALDALVDIFFLAELFQKISISKVFPSKGPDRRKVHDQSNVPLINGTTPFLQFEKTSTKFQDESERNLSEALNKFTCGKVSTKRAESAALIFNIGMTVPIDILGHFAGVSDLIPFKINHLFRVFLLQKYLDQIMEILEEHGILSNISLQRLAFITVYRILACHFFACLFFWASKVECEKGVPGWLEEWHFAECTGGEAVYHESVSSHYLRALYWSANAVCLTSYGLDLVPKNKTETIVTVVTELTGLCFNTSGLAVLTLFMINSNAARTAFQTKMDYVLQYMRYRQLPANLKARITSFFNYRWNLLKGVDEQQFLDELPPSLKQQVSNLFVRDLLQGLPTLMKSNNALLNALAETVEVHVYSPRDEILRPGEVEPGALIVSRGDVEVHNVRSHQVEQVLKPGECYCECALFMHNLCSRRLVAVSFCEVLLLPTAAFQKVIHEQCSSYVQQEMKSANEKSFHSKTKQAKMFGGGANTLIDNIKGYRRSFLPNSHFRKNWDISIFFGLVFYSISIPLHFSVFGYELRYKPLLYAGLFVDAVFFTGCLLAHQLLLSYERGNPATRKSCKA